VKVVLTNAVKVSVKPVTIWGLRSKFAPLVQNQIVNRGREANSKRLLRGVGQSTTSFPQQIKI